MTMATSLTYLLRGIDPILWRRVKAKAAAEGHSVRWVVLTLLQRYLTD